ncbi:NAD(P)-dependent oxidoreductase [Porticoccaceae bacterium]|nr:NAD(P)-dependent oxidoreductase [Porticoccaceae bacterium]
MNILIIGGNGFVGSQLLLDLRENIPSAKICISTSRRQVIGDNIEFVDYSNYTAVKCLLARSKPQYIIHLATSCMSNLSDDSLVNGQLRDSNIIDALVELELKSRLIFVASMAVFGVKDQNITPKIYSPTSSYGLEKLYMINRLEGLAIKNINFSFKIVYPSSIYGKGQKGKMLLPRLFEHIQSGKLMEAYGGNKKRDFVHVKDVSSALVKLILKYEKYLDKYIFVHSFNLYKISEIANMVCEITGLNPEATIVFHDSKYALIKDDLESQVVAEDYRLHPELMAKIPIFDGLNDMFNMN